MVCVLGEFTILALLGMKRVFGACGVVKQQMNCLESSSRYHPVLSVCAQQVPPTWPDVGLITQVRES